MTSIERPAGSLPDNLPILTQVVVEEAPDDLPTLTEVVAEGQEQPTSRMPGEDEIQRLLPQLEAHMESLFARKLENLEQLHRQAIEQAIHELRAELPELLRDALKAPAGL